MTVCGGRGNYADCGAQGDCCEEKGWESACSADGGT